MQIAYPELRIVNVPRHHVTTALGGLVPGRRSACRLPATLGAMSMAQLRTALLAVRRDLGAVEGTATNDAGTITAVVDGHGVLRDLVLNPRVYRDAAASAYRLTSSVLAR